MADPSLANDRMDIEDPKCKKSSTDMLDPQRIWESTDRLLDNRQYFRNDNPEPRFTMSRMDIELLNRPKP